jgi:hypothetical protein
LTSQQVRISQRFVTSLLAFEPGTSLAELRVRERSDGNLHSHIRNNVETEIDMAANPGIYCDTTSGNAVWRR